MGFPHTNHWERRACQSGILSPAPDLWAQQKKQLKRGPRKCQQWSNTTINFSVLPGPHYGGTYRHTRTRHTAQSVWVSPSSPSLVSGASGLQPCHCRSARPQQSVAGEEKSGILYIHIYLPAAGLLQLAGFPPALKSSSSLIPRQGQLGGWAEMACRGGMQDGETPPDPREANGILLRLLGDKASLRSQSFPGNTFPSLGCQAFTFPLGGGGRRSS